MNSGRRFEFICPCLSPIPREAGLGWRIASVLRASCGSCGRGLPGASCPAAAPLLAGAASRSGKRREYSLSSGGPSWPSSMTERSCAGMSALPMAASPQRKRGGQGRQDQAGQGDEVDGSGRWRGYSAGSIPGLGFPGRGDALGEDARHGGRPAGRPARAAAPAPRPADRRSGLRQQSTPVVAEAAGDRADHPGTAEQPEGHRPGWAEAAAVQEAVDCGAHHRLAGELPEIGGAL